MADGRHFEKKTVKSPYLCNRLIDFDEIWYSDAHWHHTVDLPLKFPIFWKSKMAAAAILKNHKTAISPQRFDRSLWNLVCWRKMGFLPAAIVKKYEFHKSTITDGGYFEQSCIILSLQPFDWFWLNLARWCMLVPRAWRKVQIFNFRQSYTADHRR